MVKKRKTVKKKKTAKRRTTKKKVVRKRKTPAKKNAPKKTITQTTAEVKVERILIENFVALQRVLTNVSLKLDGVTTQISKLLNLFELSAKALAEKDFKLQKEGTQTPADPKMEKKLDTLIDQNKIIARGLTMIHERPNTYESQMPQTRSPPMQPSRMQPLPPMRPMQSQALQTPNTTEEDFSDLETDLERLEEELPPPVAPHNNNDEIKYDQFMDK